MSSNIQKTYDRNELRRMLLENGADVDYMHHLLSTCPEQQKSAESNQELRLTDEEHNCSFSDDEEEKNDPDYMRFIANLKEHNKAYMIEYEEDGSRAVIPYEGVLCSDIECDQEPRETLRKHEDGGPSDQMPRAETQGVLDSGSQREENPKSLALKGDSSLDRNRGQQFRKKLRSALKQNDEHFNQTEKLTRMNSRSKSTSEEEDVVVLDPVSHRVSSQNLKRLRAQWKSEYDEDMIQLDPEYDKFHQGLKLVNNHYVYKDEDNEVVYNERNEELMKVNDDDDDDSCSDLEIIDSTTFYKAIKGSNSHHRDETGLSEFRRKVIAALEKPFDKEEYNKLWRDIKLHKPKERHLDLRCGRERQVGTQEDGKSYLDYYPALDRKLRQVQGDRPKRLNLLRGFFLWIKQPEEFFPWLDDECLAVCPRSR
ncbi:uncharacterized protein LOC130992618 isoform X2 [Salvia miltiorrhiza]|uniref:uncharacterized protein LOC130992618 isoform X2 n=1 Tax=Salvia miltiorrhiza TaxID=226208 RepID=UPI0025AD768F|nr:uncharacterized protein LOC130992618 isoform X2 [Salvia miltiorrhiza]XP_057773312.1 uncharacterized protein LOC130992618 isoform X2 [Salvia miltiorrhiza]XP_057773313.1 uncharacterized protein LOC130992618 isoform X2 [Salvia miltiorrhiza]XP_057773314.1 uncharacterized protein LOC130992618 isoform X2 [Salvia miltiorrhiza]